MPFFRIKQYFPGENKKNIKILNSLISSKDVPHILKKLSGRKAPYTTSICEGSVTVEASLIMPLVIFAFMVFIQVMTMIGVHTKLQTVLDMQSKRVAGYGYFVNSAQMFALEKLEAEDYQNAAEVMSNGITEVLVKRLVIKELGTEFIQNKIIDGGSNGIQVIFSPWCENGRYDVILRYHLKPLYDFFGTGGFYMTARSVFNIWTGTSVISDEDKDCDEGEDVYVTRCGTVYHLYEDCTYIKPEVEEVKIWEINSRRNASGGIYYPCSTCSNRGGSVVVYITKYGDRYHIDKNCRQIDHNVICIKKNEVGGKTLCSKCRIRREKQ